MLSPDKRPPAPSRYAQPGTSDRYDWLRAVTRTWREHSPAALAVCSKLFSCFNQYTGKINPGTWALAEATDMTERGVRQILARLREAEWIDYADNVGGRGRHTEIYLSMHHVEKPLNADVQGSASETRNGKGRNPERNAPETRNGKGRNPEPCVPPDEQREQIRRTLEHPLREAFEDWFSRMPKRTLKEQAWKAYKIARTKVSAEVLLEAATKYAASCKVGGTEEKFIRNAPGWLKDERWTDEPSSSSAGAPVYMRPRVADRDPGLSRDDWRKALDRWFFYKEWRPVWGPEPSQLGCFAPKELMDDVGIRVPTFAET
jgi:hypothetical protein